MHIFTTGVDTHGKSCVVSTDELVRNAIGADFKLGIAYENTAGLLSARPHGDADLIDQQLAPGGIRWILVEYGPDATTPVHHTDTLDLETVISGSVELILDDGAHLLEKGDMVVMTGVDHSWKAGPNGCQLSAVLIGTPPPAD
jgi:quercetin dioxygenase-like cupin family protein